MIRDLESRARPPAIGLLTGNIRLGAQIKLSHYRLSEHFRLGAFGDDHEDRNQLAVVALERGSQFLNTQLCGDEVLVVGDTPKDIACGRAINARVLAVATGGSAYAELARHQPDWLVRALDRVNVAEVCAADARPPAANPGFESGYSASGSPSPPCPSYGPAGQ